MKLLFLFLDGVGLGIEDPKTNPFARTCMPHLESMLNGQRLVIDSFTQNNDTHSPFKHMQVETERATLLSLDACLNTEGLPQSASGQASLLTGKNIPAMLGYHYGPKPNQSIAELLDNGNLFDLMEKEGYCASLLNAYPPRYFEGLESGRRLPGAVAMAARQAGLQLKTSEDLFNEQALSADLTGQGWRDQLGIQDTPVITPFQAGERLAQLAMTCDFSFFEFWPSDIIGHRQDMAQACRLLESLDQVVSGLLNKWDDSQGLILVTSDHGNLEDLSTRRHTRNPVPALVIGAPELRQAFTRDLRDLTDVAPAILGLFGVDGRR